MQEEKPSEPESATKMILWSATFFGKDFSHRASNGQFLGPNLRGTAPVPMWIRYPVRRPAVVNATGRGRYLFLPLPLPLALPLLLPLLPPLPAFAFAALVDLATDFKMLLSSFASPLLPLAATLVPPDLEFPRPWHTPS